MTYIPPFQGHTSYLMLRYNSIHTLNITTLPKERRMTHPLSADEYWSDRRRTADDQHDREPDFDEGDITDDE